MLSHKSSKNVLFIITDQQRWDAVGYNNSILSTPNIDKLSKQSTILNNAYVQSPQCQPSRASIFTGRYPTAHKLWWNTIDLAKTEKTIGNILSETHKTAFFGKAHFSSNNQSDITDYGFHYGYLYENWCSDYYMQWDIKAKHPKAEYQKCMLNPCWAGTLPEGSYHDDVITDLAIEWIQKSKAPTFTVVSYCNPHPPYAAKPPYCNMYRHIEHQTPSKPAKTLAGHIITHEEWQLIKSQYYGMVSWIDDCVGKLLSVVDDETTVIFTSDHGDILGDHGLFSKGLFTYDGNTKVPLLIRDIDLKQTTYNHLVQSIDIVPTMLGLLDIPIPLYVQGRDLTDYVLNNTRCNEYVLSMIGYDNRIRMIRDNDHKYWNNGKKHYLFDMQNDRYENNNINDTNLINMMRSKLLDALISAEDPYPAPETWGNI